MCADIVIWARGLPAQQGRYELTRFCHKSLFYETLQNFKLRHNAILPGTRNSFVLSYQVSFELVVRQNLKLNLVTFCQINISKSLLCNI